MNVQLPYDMPPGSENGMGRFFSPTNLHRYRSLVDDKIDGGERTRVLELLADEWGAFTRECRTLSASSVGSKTSFSAGETQSETIAR
jgi:hypothetical protein